MIIGLGIASLFTYALGANTRADDRELAMTIAQKRMESLRTIPFTTQTRMLDISVGGLKATLPEGVTETVESAGRSFTVNTQIQDMSVVPLNEPDEGAPTSKSIRVAVTPRQARLLDLRRSSSTLNDPHRLLALTSSLKRGLYEFVEEKEHGSRFLSP